MDSEATMKKTFWSVCCSIKLFVRSDWYLPSSLLNDITNDFSDDLVIGRGGFAVVYKGMLRNGTIAVKKLNNSLEMHEDNFKQEVTCLVGVNHKNIVRFLGYCSDTQGKMLDYKGKLVMADERQRMLCFEYLPKGCLHNYITDASCVLEWRARYQIIKGVCEGLHYLHQNDIVHLDLKPANILLDDNMVPKIAEFGLSRCFDENQTHATILKAYGTIGYMALEAPNRKIRRELDIYSLGVVIAEILTRQKGYPAVENVRTFRDHTMMKVLETWKTRMGTSAGILLEQVRVCTDIAIDCMSCDPRKRPHVQHIIDMLSGMESMNVCCTGRVCSKMHSEIMARELHHTEHEVPPDSRFKKTVVLYTTTLGGIMKTFENCNKV
ncbi:cysteine-rich receptor-like protein kinase 7 isoform X3 [Panicum virgatum]|uniref:cysteine-rich receptor-like protein kinase 7 isoform X3 n=2 Tax=Panicum virgatum TaxID=38727 RepID=UPI0019D569F8|nr:cysteine-rich receptor-like protein kinase 7 isoform X3 [Panicum virgatum]